MALLPDERRSEALLRVADAIEAQARAPMFVTASGKDSDTMEAHPSKAPSGTLQTHSGSAISSTAEEVEGVRVIASQAADELLNINGVTASFVLYLTGTQVNISARSLGKFNVQVVMEKLGGGGHMTMAAAQLPDTTLEDGIAKLKAAIDEFRMEQAQEEAEK